MRGLLAMLVLLVAVGCGSADGAGPAAAAVDTVAGVERWSYPAERTGDLAWSLDTVAVLGDPFAEDEYQFGDVSWERLAGDTAGNLYVLDRQGSRVLKYDPSGRHLQTFGRKGEGPGELSQPLGLTVGPGDTIWVTDFSNARLTGFPQEGGDPRTPGYPDGIGLPAPVFAAVEDGFIQSFRPTFGMRAGPGGPPRIRGAGAGAGDDATPPRLPVVRMDGALQPVDTLWTIPAPPTDMVRLEVGNRVMIAMMARQFTPALRWQPFSDGSLVVSDTSAYLLRLLDRDGDLLRMIAREPPPRPVTEQDRELARQRMREAETGGGVSVAVGGGGGEDDMRRRLLEERLAKMTFAEEIPRVVALRVDARDRIWVGVAEEVPDSVARIDIYDREGTLLGELRGIPMPDVFTGHDRVGVLRTDELDVQQVVLLRLREREASRGE